MSDQLKIYTIQTGLERNYQNEYRRILSLSLIFHHQTIFKVIDGVILPSCFSIGYT